MTRHQHTTLVLASVALVGSGTRATAQCAPFYDSLNDPASVQASGGVINGPLDFAPGVNGNAAVFGGATSIVYSADVFTSPTGSAALWFRKTSPDEDGGILQIGTVGQPNGLGVFYAGTSDAYFEIRNHDGTLAQVAAPGVLSDTEWTHLVAAWNDRGDACDLWLSVNGRLAASAHLPGVFRHDALTMQIGTTGYYGYAEGMIDELRFFDWALLDSEVYAEYVYSSNRHRRQPTPKPVSTGPVQIVNKSLFVDGEPFTVRGVGYAPTPIGCWPGECPVYTDAAILARDIPLLDAMNVNTVRTWAQPPDPTLLDALYYGATRPIYAIVGFWIPLSGIDYADPATISHLANQFRGVVRQFKHHPAVLGWGIGNEVNLHHSGPELVAWYDLANHLAEVAYVEEGAAYHPTIIVNAGMYDFGDADVHSDDRSLEYVDIWGHNTYFGADAHCYFDYYDRLSAKPLIFTEFGIDALDHRTGAEYPDTHAEYVVRQWRQIETNCAGGTVMAYSDEWWKADDPHRHDPGGYATGSHPDGFSNEEWWGLLAAEDAGTGPDTLHPRLAYFALGQEYAYAAGDADSDGDVDLLDFAVFQRCRGSDATGLCGAVFDFAADGAIDGADLPYFNACFDGPERPALCAE
jgi:hypothetical protein